MAARRVAAGSQGVSVALANGWSDADVGAAAGLAAALEHSAVLYAQDADTAGDVTVSALARLDPVRVVIIGATNSVCCVGRSTDLSSPTPTGACSERLRPRSHDRAEPGG